MKKLIKTEIKKRAEELKELRKTLSQPHHTLQCSWSLQHEQWKKRREVRALHLLSGYCKGIPVTNIEKKSKLENGLRPFGYYDVKRIAFDIGVDQDWIKENETAIKEYLGGMNWGV